MKTKKAKQPWHVALIFNKSGQATYHIADNKGKVIAMCGTNPVIRDEIAGACLRGGVKFGRPVVKSRG